MRLVEEFKKRIGKYTYISKGKRKLEEGQNVCNVHVVSLEKSAHPVKSERPVSGSVKKKGI
jgi:hypothetical protein